ncbi:hypothetical protein HDU85_001693 [Gaertneriomyces sp. JEL0708]|nr:hypothetical protein HDU85_001693 [Gaertneriomyces sp. JEL0708]
MDSNSPMSRSEVTLEDPTITALKRRQSLNRARSPIRTRSCSGHLPGKPRKLVGDDSTRIAQLGEEESEDVPGCVGVPAAAEPTDEDGEEKRDVKSGIGVHTLSTLTIAVPEVVDGIDKRRKSVSIRLPPGLVEAKVEADTDEVEHISRPRRQSFRRPPSELRKPESLSPPQARSRRQSVKKAAEADDRSVVKPRRRRTSRFERVDETRRAEYQVTDGEIAEWKSTDPAIDLGSEYWHDALEQAERLKRNIQPMRKTRLDFLANSVVIERKKAYKPLLDFPGLDDVEMVALAGAWKDRGVCSVSLSASNEPMTALDDGFILMPTHSPDMIPGLRNNGGGFANSMAVRPWTPSRSAQTPLNAGIPRTELRSHTLPSYTQLNDPTNDSDDEFPYVPNQFAFIPNPPKTFFHPSAVELFWRILPSRAASTITEWRTTFPPYVSRMNAPSELLIQTADEGTLFATRIPSLSEEMRREREARVRSVDLARRISASLGAREE